VVIFNERLAEVAAQYLKKGMKIYLEGQLQTRKWTDKESGQEKYTTEVVLQRFRGELQMLDSRGGAGADIGNGGMSDSARPSGRTAQKQPAGGKDFDDDIPF
jgi:single-strand DNA-binding protein